MASLLWPKVAQSGRKDLLFLPKVGILTLRSTRAVETDSALRGHVTGAQRFSCPVWRAKNHSATTTGLKCKPGSLVLLLTAREVLGEEPPPGGTVALLEKSACLAGGEPDRLTLALANSLAFQGPGDWKNWPASGGLLLYQALGSCSSAGWWRITQPI